MFDPDSISCFNMTDGNFTYTGNFTSGLGVAKYGANLLP